MSKTKFSVFIISLLILSFALSACSINGDPTVATVNGEKIKESTFNVYLKQVKQQIEQQQNSANSPNFWETAEVDGKKAIDAAKEKALDEAVKALLVTQKSKENNLKLDSNDNANITKQKNQIIQQLGGEDKFKAELTKQGLTEDFYQKLLENSVYTQKLTDIYAKNVSEADARKYFDTEISRVKHVLIMTVDANQKPLSKEKQDEAKQKAEAVLAEAKSGTDFDTLVKEKSEDPGSKSSPDGYYVGEGFALGMKGGMVQQFEKAALALKVGEISDIVETSYGYHIIKRYPNDPAMFDKNKQEVTFYAKAAKFKEIQDKWKSEAKINLNESVYNKIK